MEYPVIVKEKTVGSCVLEEQGLYWVVRCSCAYPSEQVERLYCGDRKVGVLEPDGDRLTLCKKLSRSAWPELPPSSGAFSLTPSAQPLPWKGEVLEIALEGLRRGDALLFPYDPRRPCPCEPLFCFFTIEDGFWKLPLTKKDTA